MPEASHLLSYGFVALMIVTLIAFVGGVQRSAQATASADPNTSIISGRRVLIGLLVWLALTGAAAASGVTARWELRPPPVMVIVLFGFGLTILFARGQLGTQVATGLPVAALIAFQAFRIPLELILHLAYTEGVMPIQMSYSGYNFDILSGLGGLTLGGFFLLSKREVPRSLAWAYNLMGLALLFTIVGIAIASMPLLAAFGPDKINTWIGDFPFVWLPAIFVTFALFGHLVLTRRLLADARVVDGAAGTPSPSA